MHAISHGKWQAAVNGILVQAKPDCQRQKPREHYLQTERRKVVHYTMLKVQRGGDALCSKFVDNLYREFLERVESYGFSI